MSQTFEKTEQTAQRPLNILILEDVASDAELIRQELQRGKIGFSAQHVVTRDAFRRALEETQLDLILADYSLPAFDGMSALAIARERCPDVPFIFVSGAIGEERAIEILKEGATDYVLKERLSRLVPSVQRALAEARERSARRRAETALQEALDELRLRFEEISRLKAQLEQENIYLREEIQTQHNFEEIVGQSLQLRRVLRRVEMAAPTDSSVLISGETGTGKELIARAIHNLSRRKGRPLIKVNCAALAPGVIESELFGHEKGAFTGAISRKVGRFELADRGTLFLDEIGDLPPEVQAKLLRVLQEHEFERVGGTQSIRVDVRLITATNRDLGPAVEENRFRVDLYYRLNVFPIDLPPLRERKDDIPRLVNYFVTKFSTRLGKKMEKISQAALQRLIAYPWPGNVRELQNVIERSVILSKGNTLEIEDDIFLPVSTASDGKESRALTLEEVERSHIIRILERTGWIIEGPKGAAKVLGLHPSTLRGRMQKLRIERTRPDLP